MRLSILFLLLSSMATAAPPVMLADHFHPGIELAGYWVSEKLDGVRAWWDGHRLLSRKGNPFPAPAWFTAGFPQRAMDGELWMGRGRFEETVGIVRDQHASDAEWRKIRYMVFDLPSEPGTFDARLPRLKQLISTLDIPWLRAVEQIHVADEERLMKRLKAVVDAGGEGLMLHRGRASYRATRSDDLLKLKPWWDAEATVIAHLPGKGKYRGMLGALLVRDAAGRQFRLGSGFRDAQRLHPPPIGATVTYRYRGLTKNGLPRFASFLRIRRDEPPPAQLPVR